MPLVLVAEGNPSARFPLTGTIVIGRSRLSDIVLDNPAVSRVHCRLSGHGASNALLEDMESSHGTVLNGLRVQGRAPLKAGDRLQIGPYVFLIYDDGDASDPEAHTLRPSAAKVPSGAFVLQIENVTAEEERSNPPPQLWRDSLQVGNSKAVFLLGEIVGDPIPGLKTKLRSALRRLANKHAGEPAQLLAGLNRAVHESRGRAVGICALLDPPRDQLTYACSVFHPPWVVRSTGRVVIGEVSPSLELGQVAAARFQQRRVQLQAGDTVVLHNNELSALVGRGNVEAGDKTLLDTIGQQPADVPAVAQRMRGLLQQLHPFPGVAGVCVGFARGSG
ncbi:MAG: FHA domain-containing protein [Myxococcales bacterium]|nr:FHA domain-containing protein [Myxococcales bacterium]